MRFGEKWHIAKWKTIIVSKLFWSLCLIFQLLDSIFLLAGTCFFIILHYFCSSRLSQNFDWSSFVFENSKDRLESSEILRYYAFFYVFNRKLLFFRNSLEFLRTLTLCFSQKKARILRNSRYHASFYVSLQKNIVFSMFFFVF